MSAARVSGPPRPLNDADLDRVLADLAGAALDGFAVERARDGRASAALILRVGDGRQIGVAARPGETVEITDGDGRTLTGTDVDALSPATVRSARAVRRGDVLAGLNVELDRGRVQVNAAGPGGLRAGAIGIEEREPAVSVPEERFVEAAMGRTVAWADTHDDGDEDGPVRTLTLWLDDGASLELAADGTDAALTLAVDAAGTGVLDAMAPDRFSAHVIGLRVQMLAAVRDETGRTCGMTVADARGGGVQIVAHGRDGRRPGSVSLRARPAGTAARPGPRVASEQRPAVLAPRPGELKRIVRSMRGRTLHTAELIFRDGPDFPPTGVFITIPDGRDAMINAGRGEPFAVRDQDVPLDADALADRADRSIARAWATVESDRVVRITFQTEPGEIVFEATGPSGLATVLAEPGTSVARDASGDLLGELLCGRQITRARVHEHSRLDRAVTAITLDTDDGAAVMLAGRLDGADRDGGATLTFADPAEPGIARRERDWIERRLAGMHVADVRVNDRDGHMAAVTLAGPGRSLTIAAAPLLSDRPAGISACRLRLENLR